MFEINTTTLDGRVDLQHVGTYYEVKPVPLSGKILFRDIGNLAAIGHTGAADVDLNDPAILQMLGEKDPIKPIDPKDFRGAIWGAGTKVDWTDYIPPTPPDTWFAALLNSFPGDNSSCVYDAGQGAMRLQADVRDTVQSNWNKFNEVACIYYVGRLPAGTKLKAQVAMKSANQDKYGRAIEANVRGWKDGWFGGDQSYHTYLSFSKNRSDNEYAEKSGTFTVIEPWQDIWVTCEVTSNNPRYAKGDQNIGYFRDYKISLA